MDDLAETKRWERRCLKVLLSLLSQDHAYQELTRNRSERLRYDVLIPENDKGDSGRWYGFPRNDVIIIGPYGITSSIAPFLNLLVNDVIMDSLEGLGFLVSPSGAVYPYYDNGYHISVNAGVTWNSGEGGRGYKNLKSIFAYLSKVFDVRVKTINLTEAEGKFLDDYFPEVVREVELQ